MGKTSRKDIPKEVLRDLYEGRKLSSLEIGEQLGASKAVILRRLRQYGIPRRELKEAFSVSKTHQKNARRSGADHPRFSGGRKMFKGYILIHMPDHPEADQRGYIFEHRWMAEQKIGRRLTEHESVHHENGRKADNRPGNLAIMTKSDHMKLHAQMKHEAQLEAGISNYGFRRIS